MLSKNIKLPISEIFTSIQGEPRSIGKQALFIRFQFCNLRCQWCFVGNTFVATPDGHKKIKDIKVGDDIFAYKNGKIDIKKVTKKFERIVCRDEILKIELEEGCSVFCSSNHRFYTNKGWKKASELQFGDEIYYFDYNHWYMKNKNPRKYLNGEKWQKVIEKLKNRKFSDIHKKRISIAKSENPTRNFGEKNGNYRGGITQMKYSHNNKEWQILREIILKRDKKCLMCGAQKDLVVHHIDFNTSHNVVENLCCLCRSCNSKINHGRFKFQPNIKNGKRVIAVNMINEKQATRLRGNNEKIRVYNLEVKDYNTYFVNNLLVHNCDTKYASRVEKIDSECMISLYDIQEEIKKSNKSLIVFTGGEPLLWKKSLRHIIRAFPKKQFEIETNCTIEPLKTRNVFYNVSPKLESSGNPKNLRYKPSVYKSFLKVQSLFKFVVSDDKDWKEMEQIVKVNKIPKERVWVMPEGATKRDALRNARKIIDKIVKSGYNFAPRVQVYLWGKKKAT